MATHSKTFSASRDQLTAILSWAYGQVGQFLTPSKERLRVELALEEAIVNILSYARSGVILQLTITIRYLPPDRLEIELKDNGIPFNPISQPIETQNALPLQERRAGGLGIVLLKESVDGIAYRFEGGCNVLTLTKNLPQGR